MVAQTRSSKNRSSVNHTQPLTMVPRTRSASSKNRSSANGVNLKRDASEIPDKKTVKKTKKMEEEVHDEDSDDESCELNPTDFDFAFRIYLKEQMGNKRMSLRERFKIWEEAEKTFNSLEPAEINRYIKMYQDMEAENLKKLIEHDHNYENFRGRTFQLPFFYAYI